MNILMDSNIPLLKESLINEFNIISFDGGDLTKEYILESNADILIARSTTKCSESLLSDTKIKFVDTATAGIDNLDLDYLNKSNIKWGNAAGSNSISVAEFVTLAILHWCEANNKSIEDQTIGIVGYGNVGSKVSRIFVDNCNRILVYDPFKKKTEISKAQLCGYDYLLEQSSIITYHVPLTFDGPFPTHYMLNHDNLNSLGKSKLIINMARGGVINQSALTGLDFNLNNLIFDVWENEPDIDVSFAQKCFFSTPHIAGHSYEGKLRGSLNMVEALENYLNIVLDKSQIINEINKLPKISLSSLTIDSLCDLLDRNIQIRRTDNDFKNNLKRFEKSDFNRIRKDYFKHRETLSEDSFK